MSNTKPIDETTKEQRRVLRAQRKTKRAERKVERQAQAQELRKLSYHDYLQTDHWKETRRQALRRAKFSCQVCNARDTLLNVHHRTYERLGMEHRADLIVLCEGCHALFHKNGKLAPVPERKAV